MVRKKPILGIGIDKMKDVSKKKLQKDFEYLQKTQKGKDKGNEKSLLLKLNLEMIDSTSYLLPEALKFDDVTIEKGTELRLVSGVVLEPETTDGQGDIYSADEIRKSAHEFMANYSGQGNGLMHKSFGEDSLRIVESYLAPVDFKIGKQIVTKGTWVMSSLILDNKLWNLVKSGKLTGYSIRGVSATSEP